ncbi:Oxygen-insensitive NAD(P)H nitroreductase [Flavobacterium columnare]|uniref:NAD(P)H-dependent oxidoreductase n=2 Tax=Flavobacterium TaxID=237 RepID=A0A2N9PC84_9FLAO|nr:nitroreductase family protein [Flavobacterium columnare]RVU90342.1 NAD(P)H-dependent oxidoreductase [Flavobacterium columnare]SPE77951.1 Oxygen-insensitive NAD(P)H nitroreductase [Flavobacterium columnare]
MDFINLSKNRYTTKMYNTQQKISDYEIEQLKEILRLSPSSINSQPWKFIIVSNDKTKNQLAEVSYFNEQKIKEASHLVVFCAINDIPTFENQINKNLPEGAVGYYNQFIKPLPEFEIKSWLKHQIYLSLGYFLSACASMKIDSTPMEGIKCDEYDQILNLKNYSTLFAVAIGYRDENDPNQPHIKSKSRLQMEEIVEVL